MTDTTTPPSADHVGRLIDRLTQQRELYQQLKTLSDQQGELIAQGQAEQLLTVLSQRQSLVEQIAQLNEHIAPFKQHWPDLSAQISDDQRKQVNTLLEEVENLLQSIIGQDDRHRQQLQSAKEDVGRQLQQVNHAGRAINAYGNQKPKAPTAAPARFTDSQG